MLAFFDDLVSRGDDADDMFSLASSSSSSSSSGSSFSFGDFDHVSEFGDAMIGYMYMGHAPFFGRASPSFSSRTPSSLSPANTSSILPPWSVDSDDEGWRGFGEDSSFSESDEGDTLIGAGVWTDSSEDGRLMNEGDRTGDAAAAAAATTAGDLRPAAARRGGEAHGASQTCSNPTATDSSGQQSSSASWAASSASWEASQSGRRSRRVGDDSEPSSAPMRDVRHRSVVERKRTPPVSSEALPRGKRPRVGRSSGDATFPYCREDFLKTIPPKSFYSSRKIAAATSSNGLHGSSSSSAGPSANTDEARTHGPSVRAGGSDVSPDQSSSSGIGDTCGASPLRHEAGLQTGGEEQEQQQQLSTATGPRRSLRLRIRSCSCEPSRLEEDARGVTGKVVGPSCGGGVGERGEGGSGSGPDGARRGGR